MNSERVVTLIDRVGTVESEIDSMRRTVDGEELAVSDRQYLSRCFDLLEMELQALRQYLDALRQ